MIVEHLEVVDFRNYISGSFDLTAGTTVVVGDNGQGKTNLVEALGYLATLSSFRGAPNDAMVRMGADTAIIRARVRHDDDREILVEAEIASAGRNRVQVNRQRLARARDLLGTLRITVFSPDDLILVKGGPSDRRRFLDDTLVALRGEVRRRSPRTRPDRQAAQHAAPASRRATDRRGRDHTRRVGRAVLGGRRAVRTRTSDVGGPIDADGRGGVRAARRHGGADRAGLRTAVARARIVGRARRGAAPPTSGEGRRRSGPTATS